MTEQIATKKEEKKKSGLMLWNGYAVAEHVIEFNGLHYNDQFNLVDKYKNEVEDLGKLIRRTKCFINSDCLKVLRGEHLPDYLQDKLNDMLNNKIESFEKRLMQYRPDHKNSIRRLLSYIIIDPQNLYIAEIAFTNFIIQVKCNILGLQVHRPAMPILVGEEGYAKTGFMRLFCDIFGSLFAEFSLDQVLNTEMFAYRLASKRVVLIEEMAGAGKTDLEAWKKVQTAKFFDSRVMREKFDKRFKKKVTFAGTSNKFSWQQLKDPTSNRRLIDIRVENKMKPSDFKEAAENIDIWDIWQSVKVPETIQDIEGWNSLVDSTIGEEQQKVKLKTFTQEFMSEFEFTHGGDWFLLQNLMKAIEYHSRMRGTKKDIIDNRSMANYLKLQHKFDTKVTNKGLAVMIDRRKFLEKLTDCYGQCVASDFNK